MENKNMISRRFAFTAQGGQDGPPKKTGMFIGIAITVIVLVVGGIFSQKIFAPVIEVKLATAAWTSPSQSNAILRQAVMLSPSAKQQLPPKQPDALCIWCVEASCGEGPNHCKAGRFDMRAILAQARASLAVNEADLKVAEQILCGKKRSGKKPCDQADFENAEVMQRLRHP